MSPLCTISFSFAKLSRQPSDGSVHGRLILSKTPCSINALAGAFRLLSLIFARSPTNAKPRRIPCSCSCRALRCEFTPGPSVGLACLARCHARLAQFRFSLCGLLGFVQVALRNMVTVVLTSSCPVALARPQTRQSFFLAQPVVLRHCGPIRPQLLTVFRRLLLAQLIIILLISDFPQYLLSFETLSLVSGN